MSDVTQMSDITQETLGVREAAPFRLSPLALYAGLVAAGAAGLLAGRAMGGSTAGFEDGLVVVLRFMAAIKLAGVFGGAALLHWRLAQPIAPRLALAYAASLVAMATATGLIWSLGGIVLGAILFHIGLFAFLILALRDDGVRLPGHR